MGMRTSFDSWQCPYCGYCLSDDQMQHLVTDVKCRCGNSLAAYAFVPAISADQELSYSLDKLSVASVIALAITYRKMM